jgi:hypothetical protein
LKVRKGSADNEKKISDEGKISMLKELSHQMD